MVKGIIRRNDYAFVDKHNVIDEIRTAIQDSGEPVEYIAHSAGVCPATVHAWLNGRTKHPYTTSLEKVARALGKRLTFVDAEVHIGELLPPPHRTPRRHAVWGWRRYQ